MRNNAYAVRPSYGELVAILLAGLGHVVVEIASSDLVARGYNVGVSIAFVFYLVWRVRRSDGVLRTWGMRCDNFLPAMRAQLWFVAVGVVALITFALVSGSLFLPATFWTTIVLYPVWGVAQQFALQNLIARNLSHMFSNPLGLAICASALFGISHYPRLELVALTFVAGIAFTLVYRKFPNLWAVGIAHGVLGSLVVYNVLGEDPGATILGYLTWLF